MNLNRRQFFLATLSTAAAIAVPELWVPKRTIFLPPRGGWGVTPVTTSAIGGNWESWDDPTQTWGAPT